MRVQDRARKRPAEGAPAEREISPSVAILKQALQARGMRQQDLAQKTGISKDHISRIMLGKVAFPKSRDTLTLLARAVDLDPLVFQEYRRSLQVLPESTRRLTTHLKARGISQQEFIRRIPEYSEGHLQLILRGGTPFPKEPGAIEILARAAEASPFMFQEYLPLEDWEGRMMQAAAMALGDAERGQFETLWQQIATHFRAREAYERAFDDRMIARFLQRHFAPPPPTATDGGSAAKPRMGESREALDEQDEALAYMPAIDDYQPEVRRILQGMAAHKLDVPTLAEAIGASLDDLYAIVKGQVALRPGPLAERLFQALGI